MVLLKDLVPKGLSSTAKRVRRSSHDVSAIAAKTTRHLDRAEAKALALGKAARRRADGGLRAGFHGRRPQAVAGALLFATVAGGVLFAIARAMSRSGVNGAGRAVLEKEASFGERPNWTPDLHGADHQEALLDEGLEESFPASDPASVNRIT